MAIDYIEINALGNEIKQEFSQILPNGEEYIIYVEFIPLKDKENNIGYWFMQITYNDYVTDLRRICASINIFDDLINILPYGIWIVTELGIEPIFKDIFLTDYVSVRLVKSSDVKNLKNIIFATIEE